MDLALRLGRHEVRIEDDQPFEVKHHRLQEGRELILGHAAVAHPLRALGKDPFITALADAYTTDHDPDSWISYCFVEWPRDDSSAGQRPAEREPYNNLYPHRSPLGWGRHAGGLGHRADWPGWWPLC